MNRELLLKAVLIVVGLLFAATFLGVIMLRDEDLQMMLSIYTTLGVFWLLASRNPAANRSLIAFTAWSSLVHAAVMAVQSFYDASERRHLLTGTTAFAIIGITLIALAPGKMDSSYRTSSETRSPSTEPPGL